MKIPEKLPCCPNCGNTLLLIMQLYCPLGDSCYHRTLYIFACKNKSCWSSPTSWLVLRSQILDESRILTNKPSQVTEKMFETEDDWGVDNDDWGDEKKDDSEMNKVTEWDNSTSKPVADSITEIHPSNHFEVESEQRRDCSDENRGKILGEGNENVFEGKPSIENLNIKHDQTGAGNYVGPKYDCLVAHYVNVIDEPSCCENEDSHVQKLLREYERTEGSVMSSLDDADSSRSSADEKYEKDDIRHGDKVFHHFTKQVSVCPQQCIRYQWNGTPLYISTPTPDVLNAGKILCKYCGVPLVFELQLMPALVNYLKLPDQSDQTTTMKTVLAVFACFCVSYAAAKSCVTSADCAPDECCFNHQGPLIVSRRQLDGILGLNPVTPHEGVCEKYKTKGEYCSAFDTLNGHCGCGQGLHCTFVPAPTPVTAAPLPVPSKRSVYFPGPGSYMCATQN
ncbi:hypothetical protein FSP39_017923 [Pinctada imbricata]|uniref:Programmed cell death protein 2 C-terminal domain-containing protein n=1 Tax=Pinctada imbricata TaxID=66713 RepID=A0AA88XT10_PINIB|nr:hypothetical protein FSP39_017923 [Pinctada imbricata]